MTGQPLSFEFSILEQACQQQNMPLLWKDADSVSREKHLNRLELWSFIKRQPIYRPSIRCLGPPIGLYRLAQLSGHLLPMPGREF